MFFCTENNEKSLYDIIIHPCLEGLVVATSDISKLENIELSPLRSTSTIITIYIQNHLITELMAQQLNAVILITVKIPLEVVMLRK